MTGGGPPPKFSRNDELAVRIIGEDNPKLCMVPGAKENTRPIAMEVTVQNIEQNDKQQATCSTGHQKMEFKQTMNESKNQKQQLMDDLQYEVLQLEKQKLILQIQHYSKKQVKTLDKFSQVDFNEFYVGTANAFSPQMDLNTFSHASASWEFNPLYYSNK